MTEDQAHAEAAKREKHKPRQLSHKSWKALHTTEKGWHVGLEDNHEVIFQRERAEALERGRQAFLNGDLRGFLDASSDAISSQLRRDLTNINEA